MNRDKGTRFSIMKKFVLAFLALSMIPLCALGITTLYSFMTIRERAIDTRTLVIWRIEPEKRWSFEPWNWPTG